MADCDGGDPKFFQIGAKVHDVLQDIAWQSPFLAVGLTGSIGRLPAKCPPFGRDHEIVIASLDQGVFDFPGAVERDGD
jgi:hypothetical protein